MHEVIMKYVFAFKLLNSCPMLVSIRHKLLIIFSFIPLYFRNTFKYKDNSFLLKLMTKKKRPNFLLKFRVIANYVVSKLVIIHCRK